MTCFTTRSAHAVLFRTLLIGLIAFIQIGCGAGATSTEPRSEAVDERLASTQPVALFESNRTGLATTGSLKLELAAASEEPKDYWAAVSFTRTNFEEVRRFVKMHYIDPNVDEGQGYRQAAVFALQSDEKNRMILVPKSFYELRKDNKDERGLLKGKIHVIPSVPGVVAVEEGKLEEDKKKRYSDDEIRDARKKRKARWQLLMESWKKVRFALTEFNAVMSFAGLNLGKKNPKWSMKRAWVSAARGFLFSLDHHSDLISRAAWDDSVAETTDASFEGIGAILTRRQDSDYTIVESPIEGQPALKAGLRAGDVIMKVDGVDIRNWLLNKVVGKIRGKKATKVVLTISREGNNGTIDVPIIRARIDIKNVSGRLLTTYKGIGYIKLTGFVSTTTSEMVRIFDELQAQVKGRGLRGLVLDLRRNSGGLLRQGIQVSDRFLNAGKIVSVKSRGGSMEHERATPAAWKLPVVVLVNDGSASAAEIVASAIQENGRGLVLGDRTFGKASVQTLFNPFMQDDYYIKLTVARYYSPSGRTLQIHGVTPDISVAPDMDGDMPLGFREEDLSHHLSALDARDSNPNKKYVADIMACIDKSGKARNLHKKNPNPAIKFDYQLMYGADVLECMHSIPGRMVKDL
jgi:C-terminal peptidase prc